MALVNAQQEPDSRPDKAWLYQSRVVVTALDGAADVFAPVDDPEGGGSGADDAEELHLRLPPRGESELAWVQHCLAHAEPGAHVVVMMPPAAADRRTGRRVRRNLVRSGALQAVVSFPADSGQDVWVLHKPVPKAPPPALLLFVVAEPAHVAGLWRRFLDGRVTDGTGHRAVAPLDLLDEDVDLSPVRYVLPSTADDDLVAVRHLLEDAVRSLPEVPLFGSRTGDRPTTTIGDLVRASAVDVLQAPARTTVDGGEVPVLTSRDLAAFPRPDRSHHERSGPRRAAARRRRPAGSLRAGRDGAGGRRRRGGRRPRTTPAVLTS